jgi:hypothetical protein
MRQETQWSPAWHLGKAWCLALTRHTLHKVDLVVDKIDSNKGHPSCSTGVRVAKPAFVDVYETHQEPDPQSGAKPLAYFPYGRKARSRTSVSPPCDTQDRRR